MAKTPDRHPGDVLIADDGINMTPQAVAPSANGEIRYVSGQGFRFYQEGSSVGLGGAGAGISEAQHRALRQLIHFIDSGPAEGFATGAYKETTGTAFPSVVTWWTSAAKTNKIVEKLISYSGAFPSSITWRVFDTANSVLATVTDTISYSGPFESTRTRAIT